MIDFVALGTFGFWIVLALISIGMICALELDSASGSTTAVIALALLVLIPNHIGPSFLLAHWQLTLAGITAYFVIGTVWSVLKWYFFVTGAREHLNDRVRYVLRESYGGKDLNALTPQQLGSFWSEVTGYSANPHVSGIYRHAPIAAEHKARILRWMTYWPWSATWTLVHDPVTRAFRFCYRQIADLLQRISNHAYGDLR